MKNHESHKPITYLKTNSADLMDEVKDGPIVITQNGEPKAVIQDLKSYEEQKNTLLLLKIIALGEKEILLSDTLENSKVFKSI